LLDSSSLEQDHENYATIDNVRSFVVASGVSKVDISLEDIETILNVLVYDGKIERLPGTPTSYRAKTNWTLTTRTVLTEIPCGVCPVIRFCSDQGPITPAKCPYYQAWLDY
jgi:DNA-directed RNA polymerase III subunit RPC6